jgi:hypothetical protein
MTMTFICTLTCSQCRATLRFENERPAWKAYDYRVEQSDECERSARFVAEHADDPAPALGERWTAHEEAGRPRFISIAGYSIHGSGRRDYFPDSDGPPLALSIPDPYRYVDCPVCDARVREPS